MPFNQGSTGYERVLRRCRRSRVHQTRVLTPVEGPRSDCSEDHHHRCEEPAPCELSVDAFECTGRNQPPDEQPSEHEGDDVARHLLPGGRCLGGGPDGQKHREHQHERCDCTPESLGAQGVDRLLDLDLHVLLAGGEGLSDLLRPERNGDDPERCGCSEETDEVSGEVPEVDVTGHDSAPPPVYTGNDCVRSARLRPVSGRHASIWLLAT